MLQEYDFSEDEDGLSAVTVNKHAHRFLPWVWLEAQRASRRQTIVGVQ